MERLRIGVIFTGLLTSLFVVFVVVVAVDVNSEKIEDRADVASKSVHAVEDDKSTFQNNDDDRTSPLKPDVVRRSAKDSPSDDQFSRERNGQQLGGNSGGSGQSRSSGGGGRRQQNRQRGGGGGITTTAAAVVVENATTAALPVDDDDDDDKTTASMTTSMEAIVPDSNVAVDSSEAAYPNQNDENIGIAEDWLRTALFVGDNREKLVLYASLGIALGAIFVLLAIVILSYRQKQSREQRAGQSSNSSRAALNPTESAEVPITTNLYSSSPASSIGSGHAPISSPPSSSWWTQRGDNVGRAPPQATVGRSPSGLSSGQHPRHSMTSTPLTRTRTGDASSPVNGWVSETDIISGGNGSGNRNTKAPTTTASSAGSSRPGDRRGQFVDDLDNDASMTSSVVRRTARDDQLPYGSRGNELGTSGTLGQSYSNPYRHDSYRSDGGARTMQFK